MPASGPQDIAVIVSYRGSTHRITLPLGSTLAALQEELAKLTNVPVSLQKLIYKGKKPAQHGNDSPKLVEVGIRDGIKIQMLGTTVKDLEGMKEVEDEQARRERIYRERSLRPSVKPRPTGPNGNNVVSISTLNSSASTSQYKFHSIAPLAHLPNPETARVILDKLAEDPAIRHVMTKHRFSVGVLTELAPHEHPGLLGLNVNRGEAVKLRIRTDKYDGFRLYSEVRKVLCHELAHNVWGDHDNNFKELNSQLNREVYEYERAVNSGAHTLSGAPLSQLSWGSSSQQEAEARTYILGDSGTSGSASRISSWEETPDERRQKVLQATMSRLKKEEEELEHSCGTGRTD